MTKTQKYNVAKSEDKKKTLNVHKVMHYKVEIKVPQNISPFLVLFSVRQNIFFLHLDMFCDCLQVNILR